MDDDSASCCSDDTMSITEPCDDSVPVQSDNNGDGIDQDEELEFYGEDSDVDCDDDSDYTDMSDCDEEEEEEDDGEGEEEEEEKMVVAACQGVENESIRESCENESSGRKKVERRVRFVNISDGSVSEKSFNSSTSSTSTSSLANNFSLNLELETSNGDSTTSCDISFNTSALTKTNSVLQKGHEGGSQTSTRRYLTATRRSRLRNSPRKFSICCFTGYEQQHLEYLMEREKKIPSFKKRSPQLENRGDLIDFIKNTCSDLSLSLTTTNLSVMLLDLFMDSHDIKHFQLKLTALTAVLLAAKFEERDDNIPKISVLKGRCDESYTSSFFNNMEAFMLSFFKWELGLVTPTMFAEIFFLRGVQSTDKVWSESTQSLIGLKSDCERGTEINMTTPRTPDLHRRKIVMHEDGPRLATNEGKELWLDVQAPLHFSMPSQQPSQSMHSSQHTSLPPQHSSLPSQHLLPSQHFSLQPSYSSLSSHSAQGSQCSQPPHSPLPPPLQQQPPTPTTPSSSIKYVQPSTPMTTLPGVPIVVDVPAKRLLSICARKVTIDLWNDIKYFLNASMDLVALICTPPSLVAAACLFCARRKRGLVPVWPSSLHCYTTYSASVLQHAATLLSQRSDDINYSLPNTPESGYRSSDTAAATTPIGSPSTATATAAAAASAAVAAAAADAAATTIVEDLEPADIDVIDVELDNEV